MVLSFAYLLVRREEYEAVNVLLLEVGNARMLVCLKRTWGGTVGNIEVVMVDSKSFMNWSCE